ncbi:asparagine synthase-related protein [Litchfieldella rifensis]|uniref:asparagine synthase (glutamine-hydrolyzing) n=1 Tax=Litchfieldella rifensis TaxID=762643 RepID=A0ABV7LVK0_9GAMM
MSAILGRLHFSHGPVDPLGFQKAMAALDSYGREGSSTWIEGPVALGYQHLEISPESTHEVQPLAHDGIVVVADAIIDNRHQLCDQLSFDKGGRAAIPDSQIILHAYRRWGRECVSRLVGDFAFAIWDARHQVLFCARDHIGSRPLFFYHDNDRFLFSTDIRGLLAFGDISFAIDEYRVASFLIWPLDTNENSFFQHIQHVRPGHYLLVDRDHLAQQAHWHPRDMPSIRYRRHEEYSEHFRELLETAVTDRLRTRFPVGSHISGGLDSTGVTILANRLLRAEGRELDMGYTWAPPVSERYPLANSPCDERRIIGDICTQENMACHYGAATGRDFHEFLARDIAVDGTADLFEELPVMAHAGQRGTRVLLSGWGGDESATFSTRGYPAYLLKHGQWLTLFGVARTSAGGLRHVRRMARFLWQSTLLPLMPDAVYDRFTPFLRTDRLELFIKPDFIDRFPQVWSQRGLAWREYADPMKIQATLLQNGHLASRMTTWASWSAPQGLVYRYPLTDIRLLRFTLGLPPDLLWRKGVTRCLYRDALRDMLPRNLGKQDISNEKKRMDLRIECWRLLADEATKGQFQQCCDWLDTQSLRARLVDVPERVSSHNLLKFIPLPSSLQIWHLWRRYGVSG